MRKLKLFFACLLMAVLSIGQMWGANPVVFTFNSDAGLAALGITKPTSGGTNLDDGTYTLTPVSMSATDGGTPTRVWNSSGNTSLRVYKNNSGANGTLTFTCASNMTQIVFSTSITATPSTGTLSGTTWTGSATSVTFEFTANATINTISVTYASSCEKKVTISKGTPSHGDFTLSKDGAQATCDAAVTVVVTPDPDEHYKATGVTASNGGSVSGPDGEGKYTVTYAKDYNNSSEINVNFTLKDQHTVTWNNHGITSTSQVYDGEKPVFPTPNPTSCDATSTTFIGWATAAWDGKLANTDGKTVYTSASAMPDVTGAVTYYAVYAKATAGTPVPHDGPSWDRASNTVHYTDGYTFSASASAPSNKNYYQDASSGTGNIKLYHNTTAIFASTPNTVLLTASIGGGTGGKDLADAVYARLLDKDGNAIGHPTEITSHITTATGDDYEEVELDLTDITSAYGVMLYHEKESGYNVRFYSFNLSYTTGGTTYSDYMTTCAAAGTCEAPSFTPAAGTFNGTQDIELQTSTPSAHIYYTLDGSDPDDGSDEYTTAIHITQNTKIKAITYADGLNESTISEGDFKIRYAQPTLTASAAPVDGKYTSAITVTLAAEGADAIYYAIGETPTIDEEHKYTDPIALSTTGSKTINAIAVKTGYETSNVASCTYVMDLPYATIADFIASGTGSTVKRLQLTNAYILGVNGYSIYVQDASAKGIIIYNKDGYGSAEWVANLVAGNQITGVVSGTNTLYNQQPELASAAFATPTITAGTRPTPADITAINEAAFTANTMKLVKVSGVYYQESPSNKNYTFTADEDGLETAQKVYDQFGMIKDHTMVEVGDQCDLIGIMARYNANYQLLPVLVTDIAADADAAAPVFTPEGGATEGEALQVDLNSYVAITAADAKHSVDVDQVQITSTDPVSVTAVSSRDFYRSTSVTKWYYGNAASASYDITIEGVTTQGNVVAQVGGVDAISAKENDEVHVLITPNAHFALNTITVNGSAPTEVSAGTEYKFTMPDEAVTIVVTWNEDAKATLTFAKGEATGTEGAPANIVDYIGETTQLPANPFTYSGHKFIGWSCDGGATKLAAGADYVLSENKAFVAYWEAIPTFNDADHEWQLATSLEAGKYYVIGSASQDKTASKTISGGYMGELNTEIEDGVIAYDALNANTAIFLLGGNSTDGWTLTEVTTDKVLGTTANKNVSWNAGTQTWAISIAEGGNATIGGTSRILHNVNSTRFTTYTSDLSASMLLPQLYVWAEKVFKLRYDANEGSNAPAATLAVAGKATVTDERPTAPAGKIFDGWNENATGTGEDYVAGDEIAITTADVTIYAKWRDPNTYTISYNANGGTLMEGKSVIAPEDVTEGEEYSVKANVYEKEGKIFTGWQYGANIYNANDELLPTEDIEFIAQWSDPNITDYVLVTNINQLKNGDKVYIVAAATGNAMGAQYSTTYRQRVEIEKTADKSHVITTGTEPVELTLGTTDGSYYTFNDGTGYLYANSTSANNIGTQEDLTNAGKWTITIDAEGNTTIVSQGETHYNKLTYNAAQPRFAAYKNAQQAVVLYKKLETIREDGVAPGVWGTICPKNEIVNAEGASFFQISHVEYHSDIPYKVFYDEIAEGASLVAGQPYLFLADENATAIKGFKVGNDATSATNDHGFIGVLSDKLITVEAADVTAYRYYIVYDNEIRLCGEGQFRIKAERAYLDMSDPNVEKQYKAPIAGRRRVALTNNAAQNATGCENINASETPVKMIIDGQLYILRGEKMYDATGKLVK